MINAEALVYCSSVDGSVCFSRGIFVSHKAVDRYAKGNTKHSPPL